uniref:Uncharacterized protein n=1 Tax=Ciona intestinalis TaxID=7719 RepID=H2XVB2_CIOIN
MKYFCNEKNEVRKNKRKSTLSKRFACTKSRCFFWPVFFLPTCFKGTLEIISQDVANNVLLLRRNF